MASPVKSVVVFLLVAASPVLAVEVVHVPSQAATLAAAFQVVPDGGVIEVAAGTYPAPSGGFQLSNIGKGFTVRPDGSGAVILTGGGQSPILRFQNTSLEASRALVFEDLRFENGRTSQAGIAAGITVYEGEVSFVRCLFRDNVSLAATVGGALYVAENSRLVVVDSTFEDNTSVTGGAGLGIRSDVQAWISGCVFRRNRANVPNHEPNSGGGGINVGNASLRVADTLFEDNSAGGFGGGLYAIGNWLIPYEVPRTDVIVSNSVFVDNVAERDSSVTGSHSPTEGGAVNAEDQTLLQVFGCRFENNRAMIGGGVNGYRSTIRIHDSVFRGNRATDRSSTGSGFGGAVKVTSDDGPGDGYNNRPPADLLIERCLLSGQDYGTDANATVGGCLFAAGDGKRIDGDPDVPDVGTIAENRATVLVRDSIFSQCDTEAVFGQKGDGGAAYVVITDFQLENSLVIDCDARGGGWGTGWAGGVMGILHSEVEITGTTFARNTAGQFGGAVVIQGAQVAMSDSTLFANVLDQETYGSAMFSATDDGRGISATGTVSSCLFADHTGNTIFDDDRNHPSLPINDIVYNDNQFWVADAGSQVYRNAIAGSATGAQLNTLIVDRVPGLPDTDKGSGNTDLGAAPEVAKLLAAPADAWDASAVEGVASAPLAWAGSGGDVYLDGSQVAPTGRVDALAGGHSLVVGDVSASEVIGTRPEPRLVFRAGSSYIPAGGSTTLEWQVIGGTFEGAFIDQGVGAVSSSVGSVQVAPAVTTTYRFSAVSREGGKVGEATIWVGEDQLFADGFESGNVFAWSTSVP
jgi:predicted outer membrane repeat protein